MNSLEISNKKTKVAITTLGPKVNGEFLRGSKISSLLFDIVRENPGIVQEDLIAKYKEDQRSQSFHENTILEQSAGSKFLGYLRQLGIIYEVSSGRKSKFYVDANGIKKLTSCLSVLDSIIDGAQLPNEASKTKDIKTTTANDGLHALTQGADDIFDLKQLKNLKLLVSMCKGNSLRALHELDKIESETEEGGWREISNKEKHMFTNTYLSKKLGVAVGNITKFVKDFKYFGIVNQEDGDGDTGHYKERIYNPTVTHRLKKFVAHFQEHIKENKPANRRK